MSTQPNTYLTPEEYLAMERENEYRSEYIDGEVFSMTGASRRHNIITFNIAGALSPQLRGRPCEAYASEMRVRIPNRGYMYPDVVIVCGEPLLEDDYFDTLLNPTVLVEVLSKSTERYDRGKKFYLYRTIESLAEYLLIAQDEYKVEHYTKQPDGPWTLSDHRSLDDAVELDSIKCTLLLREVYEKVALPPGDSEEGEL
jgi:Uma2 family endonuclease